MKRFFPTVSAHTARAQVPPPPRKSKRLHAKTVARSAAVKVEPGVDSSPSNTSAKSGGARATAGATSGSGSGRRRRTGGATPTATRRRAAPVLRLCASCEAACSLAWGAFEARSSDDDTLDAVCMGVDEGGRVQWDVVASTLHGHHTVATARARYTRAQRRLAQAAAERAHTTPAQAPCASCVAAAGAGGEAKLLTRFPPRHSRLPGWTRAENTRFHAVLCRTQAARDRWEAVAACFPNRPVAALAARYNGMFMRTLRAR